MKIEDLIKQNKKYCKQKIIGESEEGRFIYSINLRKGKGQRKRALLISCLHGNEINTGSTNIKILEKIISNDLLNFWEITSIPIANPDGKILKTRYNSKGIDINRDFIEKKAKETKSIIQCYQEFKPEIVLDYHSNLSSEYSGILLPAQDTDFSLLKNILFSYKSVREEPHLFRSLCLYSQNKIAVGFLIEGVYRLLNKDTGALINYAANESKIAAIIEDYGADLSMELSTELLKHYIKRK